MPCRSGSELFDMVAFRAAVIAHIDRWNLTVRDLANACGCSDNGIMPWLRGDREGIGLFVACALAETCDLSLDTYRTDAS